MVESSSSYEVDRLVEKIKSYSKSYYEGTPEISDAAFDLLTDQLRRIDPNNEVLDKVGWGYQVEIDQNDSKPHKFEIAKFEDKIREANFLGINFGDGIVTPKLDGGSVVCYYVDGILDYALTRGDGYNGFDVTSKLKYLAPEALIDNTFTGMVRGEVTMLEDIFKEKYSNYESNRNLSIGLLRRKSSSVEEVRNLSFVAYTVRGTSDMEIGSKEDVLDWLSYNHFTVVDIIDDLESWDDEHLRQAIIEYRDSKKYPLDGIVITSKKYRELDDSTWVPRREVAYKTAADSELSVVRRIDWNLTPTGRMVPVINIEPVFLSGAWVSRATAFNYAFIKDNRLGEGSEVRIQRSGEVIPNIVEVLTEGNAHTPEVCPDCGHELEQVGADLVCTNAECGRKSWDRLINWINCMAPVKGLGYSRICEVLDRSHIYSVDTLYSKLDDIIEKLPEGYATSNLVVEMVEKLREENWAATFFLACMIPGGGWESSCRLGYHVDEILYNEMDQSNIDRIMGIDRVMWKTKEWIVQHIDDIRRWSTYPSKLISGQEIDSNSAPKKASRKIAVTGRLSVTRSKFFEEVAYYGFEEGSISKAEYLVTNTPNSNSSKNRTAREKGVKVVSEEEFREIMVN